MSSDSFCSLKEQSFLFGNPCYVIALLLEMFSTLYGLFFPHVTAIIRTLILECINSIFIPSIGLVLVLCVSMNLCWFWTEGLWLSALHCGKEAVGKHLVHTVMEATVPLVCIDEDMLTLTGRFDVGSYWGDRITENMPVKAKEHVNNLTEHFIDPQSCWCWVGLNEGATLCMFNKEINYSRTDASEGWINEREEMSCCWLQPWDSLDIKLRVRWDQTLISQSNQLPKLEMLPHI